MRGANINPKLYSLLIEAAEAKNIPHQLQAAPGGTRHGCERDAASPVPAWPRRSLACPCATCTRRSRS